MFCARLVLATFFFAAPTVADDDHIPTYGIDGGAQYTPTKHQYDLIQKYTRMSTAPADDSSDSSPEAPGATRTVKTHAASSAKELGFHSDEFEDKYVQEHSGDMMAMFNSGNYEEVMKMLDHGKNDESDAAATAAANEMIKKAHSKAVRAVDEVSAKAEERAVDAAMGSPSEASAAIGSPIAEVKQSSEVKASEGISVDVSSSSTVKEIKEEDIPTYGTDGGAQYKPTKHQYELIQKYTHPQTSEETHSVQQEDSKPVAAQAPLVVESKSIEVEAHPVGAVSAEEPAKEAVAITAHGLDSAESGQSGDQIPPPVVVKSRNKELVRSHSWMSSSSYWTILSVIMLVVMFTVSPEQLKSQFNNMIQSEVKIPGFSAPKEDSARVKSISMKCIAS